MRGKLVSPFGTTLKKYESNCNHLSFYEFHTDEELQKYFELAKEVIAGECFIDE